MNKELSDFWVIVVGGGHAGDVAHDQGKHQIAQRGHGRAEQVEGHRAQIGPEIGRKALEQGHRLPEKERFLGFGCRGHLCASLHCFRR